MALAGSPAQTDAARPLQELIEVPPGDACLARGLHEPVAAWLGRDSIEGELEVQVDSGDGFVGFRLYRSGQLRVERSLSPAPSDCADRRAALGLAVAMALDAAVLESLRPPEADVDASIGISAEPEATESTPAPVPDPASSPSIDEPEAAEPIPSAERALRLAASLRLDTLVGALPRVAFGGEAGLELGLWSWLDLRLAGGGAGGLPATLADGEVDTALGWGALELCPARRLGRVRVRLCLGAAAGALWARGRGFDRSLRVALPWVALRTGGDLDVALAKRVGLRVGATLLTPVVRGRVDVRDSADAPVDRSEPAAAGAQMGVGLVVRLAGPG